MESTKIELTEEQRATISSIYDTIIPVKFKWGGMGYIKVNRFIVNLTSSNVEE